MSETTNFKYDQSPEMIVRLANEFAYHAPQDGQAARYVALRDMAHTLAIHITGMTPASREQSLALTALGECVMWANASIARNE